MRVLYFRDKDDEGLGIICGKSATECSAPCSFCNLSVFRNLLTLTGERGTRQTCQQGCGGSQQPRIASPSISAGKMSQGWSQTRGWLRAALARHQLLFVNCGVSVGLSGLGDLLQQRIEQGRQVATITSWENHMTLLTC